MSKPQWVVEIDEMKRLVDRYVATHPSAGPPLWLGDTWGPQGSIGVIFAVPGSNQVIVASSFGEITITADFDALYSDSFSAGANRRRKTAEASVKAALIKLAANGH